MELSEYLRRRGHEYFNKKNVHASMIEKSGVVYQIEVRCLPRDSVNYDEFQRIIGYIRDKSGGALIVTSGLEEFRRGILSIKTDYSRKFADEKSASTMQVLLDHLLPNLGK